MEGTIPSLATITNAHYSLVFIGIEQFNASLDIKNGPLRGVSRGKNDLTDVSTQRLSGPRFCREGQVSSVRKIEV